MPSSARLIGPFTWTGHLDGRRRVWLDCKVSFWMWRPVWQANYRKEILLKRQSEDADCPLRTPISSPACAPQKTTPCKHGVAKVQGGDASKGGDAHAALERGASEPHAYKLGEHWPGFKR